MTSARQGTPTLNGHIAVLDGVRGIAVLLVLLVHFSVRPVGELTAIDALYYRAAWAGWIGVDLFFVLSGFLITRILLQSKGDRAGPFFLSFYMRRMLRIVPLYYGFLVVLFFILPAIAPSRLTASVEYQSLVTDQHWFWLYGSNLLAGIRGEYLPLVNHFWSLAVEEQFYLVWPVIIYLLPSSRAVVRACVAIVALTVVARIVVIANGGSFVSIFHLTFTRLDGLAIGALLAAGMREATIAPTLVAYHRAVLPTTGLLLLGAFALKDRFGNLFVTVGLTLLEVFFGALILHLMVAQQRGVLGRLFDCRLTRFFGQYSYGIYVLHMPIEQQLRRHLAPSQLLPPLGGSQLPGQLLFLLIGVGLSVAAAVVSYHLYEKRFLALKRFFPSTSTSSTSSRAATTVATEQLPTA